METDEFQKNVVARFPWNRNLSPEELEQRVLQRQREWEEALARRQAEAAARRLRLRMLYDNISLFWETPGLYVLDPKGRLPSREIYSIYESWCIRSDIPQCPQREFLLYTKKHAASLSLTHSTHIPDGTGKRVRGFYGIRRLRPEEASSE